MLGLLWNPRRVAQADVQPDCAWLKAALGQREANRRAETKSLTEAIQLIKVPGPLSTGIHWIGMDPKFGFQGKIWTFFFLEHFRRAILV